MAGPNIYDQIINGSFDALGMQPQQLPRRSGGGFLELLTDPEGLDALPRNSQGYSPFLEQTPGAFGNNPMAQNTGGQPIPPAPHWVNSLTGLVEGTVNGFMAPANALAGKYDQMVIDPNTGKVLSMMDPRLVDDAAAMAGLVTTSGMPIPKLPNTLGMAGGKMGQPSIASVEKMAADLGADLSVADRSGTISLDKIALPAAARGQGAGSRIVEALIEYADASGKRVVLTPSTDFGGSSVSRLKEFYKRFGFVENKGRNKDFSTQAGMYRDPQRKD